MIRNTIRFGAIAGFDALNVGGKRVVRCPGREPLERCWRLLGRCCRSWFREAQARHQQEHTGTDDHCEHQHT